MALVPSCVKEVGELLCLGSFIHRNSFRHVYSVFLQREIVFASARHIGELSTRKYFKLKISLEFYMTQYKFKPQTSVLCGFEVKDFNGKLSFFFTPLSALSKVKPGTYHCYLLHGRFFSRSPTDQVRLLTTYV